MQTRLIKDKPQSIRKHICWKRKNKQKVQSIFSLITLVFCYQNCSSDREKILKFEAEGREFAKILRSLEQFIQTVKGQNNIW